MDPPLTLDVTWEEQEDVVSSISKAVLCYVSIVGVADFRGAQMQSFRSERIRTSF